MTDRELLELAAKAAGWTHQQTDDGCLNVIDPGGTIHKCCQGWQTFSIETDTANRTPTFVDALRELGWRVVNGKAIY